MRYIEIKACSITTPMFGSGLFHWVLYEMDDDGNYIESAMSVNMFTSLPESINNATEEMYFGAMGYVPIKGVDIR